MFSKNSSSKENEWMTEIQSRHDEKVTINAKSRNRILDIKKELRDKYMAGYGGIAQRNICR